MELCDVEARDKHGQTPLHLAAKRGYEGCVSALMEKAAVDAQDKDGMTPLMHATSEGRADAAERLMRSCDVNKVDRHGRNALAIAKLTRNDEVAGRIEARMISEGQRFALAEVAAMSAGRAVERQRARSL